MKELSKSDVRFWQEKISKQATTGANGQAYQQSDYSVRIQHQGRRELFTLGTPNKYEAARKAREIHQQLVATGWDATLATYKPKSDTAPKCDCTVGEFLAELRAFHASQAKTIDNYAVPFRRIVAELAGIPSGGRGGSASSHRLWREQVEAVKLSLLTPGKIQKWKESFIVRAGDDPTLQNSARITVNSALRESRSLFSAKMLEGLEGIVLPDPLPFSAVKLEKQPSMRYRSTFDVMQLIRDAREELSSNEPELFKIFVLAVMAGLRRNEIDKLEWSSFNWHAETISIEATSYFKPKSEDSSRTIWTPPELMALFRGYQAKALGRFVLQSRVAPIMGLAYEHYRGARLFDKLIVWLRSKGVIAKKPIHELRKEFGSLITQRFGIYAAKELLGHSDISVTAAHYSEAKGKPTVGMGDLLKTPANVIPIGSAHADFGPEESMGSSGQTPVFSN
jgi:integrase